MKNVLALVAICFSLSLSACTKKEDAPPAPAGEAVEGHSSAPAENATPPAETEEKKDAAPAAH